MTASSRSTPCAKCALAKPRKRRQATPLDSTQLGPTEDVARPPWQHLKAETQARHSTSAVLAICCNWCTYIRRGGEREGEHDGPVLEGDACRDRQCGRTVALGADDRDGLSARAGHVRGHGRRADPDGLRP